MKKRVIAFFTAVAVACTSTTAYAHTDDVFGGKYTDRTELRFFVRIQSSAENDVYTFNDVYKSGKEWNGISSNVSFNIIKYDGVLTTPNQIIVYGADLKDEDDNLVFGRLVPYDKYGKKCDCYNDDWSYCRIEINNTKDVENYYYYTYGTMEEIQTAAKKVFFA